MLCYALVFFSLGQYTGVFISISGFLFISQYSTEIDAISIVLVLLAQMAYVLQSVIIKKYSSTLNPFSLAFFRMGFMLLATIPFFVMNDGTTIAFFPFVMLTGLVLLATFFSRAILYKSVQYIDVSKASLWYFWETVFIILASQAMCRFLR